MRHTGAAQSASKGATADLRTGKTATITMRILNDNADVRVTNFKLSK
jgi:hypothetical protein